MGDNDDIKRLCHFVLDELSRKDRDDSPWLTIKDDDFAGVPIRTIDVHCPQKDLVGTIMVANGSAKATRKGGGRLGKKNK